MTSIEGTLRREVARLARIDPQTIDLAASLGGLGIDSLGYVDIAAALSRAHAVDLTPETLFEHASLAETIACVQHLQEPAAPAAAITTEREAAQQPEPAIDEGDIALIGCALRVPGATDLATLWSLVATRQTQWSAFPADRLPPGEPAPAAAAVRGGFVPDAACFDAAFFGISAREAIAMDPQQRMLLECAWHAFEDAGLAPDRLARTDTAVFIGASSVDYYELLLKTQAARSTHIGTGVSHAILANRISQYFNLTGASEAVDSACASSVVALWRGVQALRRGDSSLALVGGVNLLGSLNTFGLFTDAGMLSPDGQCRPFDDAANGYVRGEGVVCAVLKPARAALRDGDRILALIKGGAVRHSGRTQSLTAPNPQAQADVIQAALDDAAVPAASIGYIEAHGTGTRLGDPIEVQGLKKVFGTAPHAFVGSIKAQIGHLEAAAGLIGVLKAVTALQRQIIPGSPPIGRPNRMIEWRDTGLRLGSEACPWAGRHGDVVLPEGPRRAGVSSFGFGGANSHLVLQEAPPPPLRGAAQPGPRLFVLSARSAAALREACTALADCLDTMPALAADAECARLDDIAYSLRCRAAWRYRIAPIAGTREELAAALRQASVDARDSVVPDATTRDAAPASEHVETLCAQGALQAIAALWLAGHDLPWRQLLPRRDARLLSLPGYPFQRQRFWAGDAPTANAVAAGVRAAAFYATRWLPSPADGAPHRDGPTSLIVWTAGPRGLAVAQHCETLARLPVTRVTGSLPPTDANAAPRATLIDLRSLDATTEAPDARAAVRLAALRQWAGATLKRGEPLQLLHATSGLCAPAPERAPSLGGSDVAAFYEHLGAEYRQCRSKTIDVAPFNAPALARALLDELVLDDEHRALAYIDGQRHSRHLQRLQWPPTDAADGTVQGASDAATPGGVALITGGTGGIGLALAADLAARGFGALMLTGRRTLSADKQAALQGLRDAGVAVELYSGSLTDAAALRSALDAFRAAHGAFTHVFHGAGTVDRATPAFYQKTEASIDAVMAPKLHALLVLHALFEADPPRAFVLFSSVSALIPALAAGVLDYAAANHALDLFAQHQHAAGRHHYLSLQWTRWHGLGLAKAAHARPAQAAALDAATCLAALHALLAVPAAARPANVCVLAEGDDLFERAGLRSPSIAAPKLPPARSDHAAAPDVRERVRRLMAQELEVPVEQLDDDSTFEALGIDSIILAGLVTQIEAWLGRPVDPQQLIDCDSIAAVARFLEGQEASASPPPAGASGPTASPRAAPAAAQPFQVAVIGMACRMPGAPDLPSFWHNLQHGVDSVGLVPPARWDRAAWYANGAASAATGQRSVSQWGGFLDGIETIAPSLFGMDAAEAADVDPLVRLFTECSLAAAADGPLGQAGLKGRRVGVFAGARAGRYGERIAHPGRHSVTGIGQNFVAAHVSHLLDLRGPSLVLDSACSSSLAAIHLACQSLRCGDSELALAGGVEVLLDEQPYLFLSAAAALSPRGRCSPFDAKADGFVPGEGVGCVLLKPLTQALADGDPVYAVIAGSAMNNDGHTLGVTTPGSGGQVEVIQRALQQAALPPRAISYVEAHGTGTLIGDPIELQALCRAFEADPPARCGIGSVKSNIGHLLSAAGVASFIKVALALQHRLLPPTLHVEQVNPRLNIERTPFCPQRAAEPWQGLSLHAGISAFGFGKTNVHVVLGEAPPAARRPTPLQAPRWQPPGRVHAWHAPRAAATAPATPGIGAQAAGAPAGLLAVHELAIEELNEA